MVYRRRTGDTFRAIEMGAVCCGTATNFRQPSRVGWGEDANGFRGQSITHTLATLLAQYGLLALFLLVLVKAIGIPIPIPIDLIILGTASGSAGGKFILWQAITVLFVAMVAGGCVQFAIARGPGRKVLYRYGHYLWLTRTRLDVVCERVRNVGPAGIGVSVITPGLRTAAIPACGLTAVPFRTFSWGLAGGTACLLAIQFFLGYAGTELVLRFWNGPAHLALLGLTAAVACGLVWLIYDHLSRHTSSIDGDPAVPAASHWCPFCALTRYALSFSGTRALEPMEPELEVSSAPGRMSI